MDQSQDRGLTVISMHQPWASLLVYGIKRIEGRGWSTEHTGRLWIHATSKAATQQEIKEMRDFYVTVHQQEGNNVTPNLPSNYPTSVLLGCVDVVSCQPAEIMENWPALPDTIKQEIGSPFCFLCENPKRLVVPQQMRGHPKLWQLPGAMAKALSPALKAPPDRIPFTWSAFGNFNRQGGSAQPASGKSVRSSLWQDKYGRQKSLQT